MATPMALNNVQFLVPVDGGVTKLQAVLPPAAWYSTRVPSVVAALIELFVVIRIYTFSLYYLLHLRFSMSCFLQEHRTEKNPLEDS